MELKKLNTINKKAYYQGALLADEHTVTYMTQMQKKVKLEKVEMAAMPKLGDMFDDIREM